MHVILVPGLWLDASSWEPVLPALRAAGHTVQALTLPGVGVPAPASAAIGMSDWIDAVVAAIDAAPGEVALVGHSGGGNVVWGAADARASRVGRVVFVDAVPPPPGSPISDFEVRDGVVPFPGWDSFEAPDVADLTPAVRARWAARTQSVPARVPTDPLELHDEERHGIPVVILSGSFDEPALRAELARWGWDAEFARIRKARVVRLGTGHWPQFSAPAPFAAALVAALA